MKRILGNLISGFRYYAWRAIKAIDAKLWRAQAHLQGLPINNWEQS